ncbi:MAG: peptidase T [Lachnospiraceae bacterium]|nr:peptidase T [Lachnospiraceae bacterium]
MKTYERFLSYVKVHTTSDEESQTMPSSARQFNLARQLVEEMKVMGISDAHVDEKGYVYGTIPAMEGYENAITLGLIAHMDTAPDFSGENVKPQIIEEYDGKDVKLGESGRVLSVKNFPHLPSLAGRTLITTDGTTLLGADDKAGVAEIMTVAQSLMNGEKKHGKVMIAFTPDEEVGRGADGFDVEKFGADFAYTVDGGAENEIEYENFNASGATVEVNGFNVHPGSSKDTMINASLVAMEFNQMLPGGDTPRDTEGYEGFFHLCSMEGDVAHAVLKYIIRDHSAEMFACRQEMMRHIEKLLNEKYGTGTVKVTIKEQYRNMKEKIEPCMHLIENAKKAAEKVGLEPVTVPVRGGTDGARLSFMGLPCPNLGTGGYAYHGPYEHITVEGMDQATKMILEIVGMYAEMEKKSIG